jgi:hypothetical protein
LVHARSRFAFVLSIVRIALQGVLFFLLLGVVMALGDSNVGLVEKLVVGAIGVLLLWVAYVVRRLGRPPAAF